ncbi:hypothetical protein WICMUC_005286 [Wickerhamomyces mucosus]|uniref:Uncharacterized protein n=1 Tax=Wickerhamomyces mucosus TaxID=1378264 RepID=A0A9P8PAL6_9ASCO|nr:hypothetical protein WICMUC_005286 [Wickerhamomyces mucosus]
MRSLFAILSESEATAELGLLNEKLNVELAAEEPPNVKAGFEFELFDPKGVIVLFSAEAAVEDDPKEKSVLGSEEREVPKEKAGLVALAEDREFSNENLPFDASLYFEIDNAGGFSESGVSLENFTGLPGAQEKLLVPSDEASACTGSFFAVAEFGVAGFNLKTLSEFLLVEVKVNDGPEARVFVTWLSFEIWKIESVVVGGFSRMNFGPSTLKSSSDSESSLEDISSTLMSVCDSSIGVDSFSNGNELTPAFLSPKENNGADEVFVVPGNENEKAVFDGSSGAGKDFCSFSLESASGISISFSILS